MKNNYQKLTLQILVFIVISSAHFYCGNCSDKSFFLLEYQGYLFSYSNEPLSSSQKVNFFILNCQGETKWQRTRFVNVKNGKFNVTLGIVKPISLSLLDGNHFIMHRALNKISGYNLNQQNCTKLLNKQISGYLVDIALKPVNQILNLEFKIFDKNRKNKWQESHIVNINNGAFSKRISTKQQFNCNFYNGQHYIKINSNNNEKKTLYFAQNLNNNFRINISGQTYLSNQFNAFFTKIKNDNSIIHETSKSVDLIKTVSNTLLENKYNPLLKEEYTFNRFWPDKDLSWYLNNSEGIAVDNENYVYISDTNNCRIKKYSINCELVLEWGGCGDDNNILIKPEAIVVDSYRNVYVIDDNNDASTETNQVIKKFSSEGEFICKWDILSKEKDSLLARGKMEIDQNDFIYVATSYKSLTEKEYSSIEKYSSDGQLIQSFPLQKYGRGYYDIAIYGDNDHTYLYLLSDETYISKILKYELKNNQLNFISDDFPTIQIMSKIFYPKIVVNNNILFVVNSNCISKIGSDGIMIQEKFAKLNNFDSTYIVSDIAIDKEDNIYMSNPVQKFSPGGERFEIWEQNGSFLLPTLIAADFKRKQINIMDSDKKIIQKFSKNGEIIDQCFWAKNSPNSKLNAPNVMAMDDDGYYYLSEPMVNRHCIEQFDKKGFLLNSWCFDNHNKDDCINSMHISKYDNQKVIYALLSVSELMNKYQIIKDNENDMLVIKDSWDLGYVPIDLAVDSQNNFYILGFNKGLFINQYDKNFKIFTDWNETISSEGKLELPGKISIGSDDYLYVVNQGLVENGPTIHKINPEGKYVTNFSEFGIEKGQFEKIGDLCAIDNEVFITDPNKRRVQIFSKQINNDNLYKAAIIIIGGHGGAENEFFPNNDEICAKLSYRALKHQGFKKNELFYLSSNILLDIDNNGKADDIFNKPTKENLKSLFQSDIMQTDNLIVYFSGYCGVNYNDEGKFRLNKNETLSIHEFNDMINDYSGKLILINDTCHSGSFLSILPASNRIVLSSSQKNEHSCYLNQGFISFSSFFWDNIYFGMSLKSAFDYAVKSFSHFSTQYPQIDDNNDGIYNQNDGKIAQDTYIGNGAKIDNIRPVINEISQVKKPVDNNGIHLSLEVIAENDIDNVWAIVKPEKQQIIMNNTNYYSFPYIELNYSFENNRYENSYNSFCSNGFYNISFYVKDKTGLISKPETLKIEVQRSITDKAIIIIGKIENKQKRNNIINNASLVYQALNYQGFSQDNIMLLSPYYLNHFSTNPKIPNLDNCKDAILNWGSNGTNDFVLYISGIGNNDGMILNDNGQQLDFLEMRQWLEILEIEGKNIIFYEADKSENFINQLKTSSIKQNLIAITSTGVDDIALLALNGDISVSNFFWKKILSGYSIENAFQYAKDKLKLIQGQFYQNPVLFYSQSAKQDKNQIGIGVTFISDPPSISTISPKKILSDDYCAKFYVENINSVSSIQKIEAIIFQPLKANNNKELLSNPVSIELTQLNNSDQYEGNYNQFSVFGDYLISVFAYDIYGNISEPKTTTITQTNAPDIYEIDNNPDQATTINVKCSGNHCQKVLPQLHNFHEKEDKDWIKFYAEPGEIYKITASPVDSNFCVPIFNIYDNKGKKIEPDK